MGRVLAVVGKELNDVRRSRLILTTMIVPTVPYVLLSIGVLSAGSLQMFGFIRLDVSHALLIAGLAALADVALLWVVVRLFNRETILTRWR